MFKVSVGSVEHVSDGTREKRQDVFILITADHSLHRSFI